MQKYGEYMNLQSIFMKINIFKIAPEVIYCFLRINKLSFPKIGLHELIITSL